MHTAAQLDQLARKLKLTHQQRRFAEALAADPKRDQTAAARAAGYTDKDLSRAGSRLAVRPKVTEYIRALMLAATPVEVVARVPAAQGKTAHAVATLTEALGTLSMIQRGTDPAELITEGGAVSIAALRALPPGMLKKYRAKTTQERDPNGERGDTREVLEISFELESASVAAQALVRHHDGLDRPEAVPGHTLNVTLSPGALRELAMAWLQAPAPPELPAGSDPAQRSERWHPGG